MTINGILLDLDDGTGGAKRRMEVRLSAQDSLALLRELVSAHRVAWHLGKPIDWRDGEQRPTDLIG